MLRAVSQVAVVGLGVGWVWLFVSGCEHPLCRPFGVYRYRIDTLSDYGEYVAGQDMYRRTGAASLTFSCDALRDQFVALIHREMVVDGVPGLEDKTRQELERIGALGARREDRTLHLTNDMASNIEAWKEQVQSLLDERQGRNRQSTRNTVIARLFDRLVLHVGSREEAHIQLRSIGECASTAKPSSSSSLP
jgi:hypothetical protein